MTIAEIHINPKKMIFDMLMGLNLPNKTESFKSLWNLIITNKIPNPPTPSNPAGRYQDEILRTKLPRKRTAAQGMIPTTTANINVDNNPNKTPFNKPLI